MRKFIVGQLIISMLFVGSIGVIAGERIASPSQTIFVLDGNEVSFDAAFDIEDSNYIQLRSIAKMLNGTSSQFNVYWDEELGKAVIETGVPYIEPPPTPKKASKIGEKIIVGTAEITILDIKKSPLVVTKEDALQTITFKVLTPETPLKRKYWYASDFIRSGTTTDGKEYKVLSGLKIEADFDYFYIYPNKETITHVSIGTKITDEFASFVVTDLNGNYKTIYLD